MSIDYPNILRKTENDILSYENPSVIARFIKEYGAAEEDAKECFNALKQFLIVCIFNDGGRIISKPVDDMWHTFILFTKDYQSFCEEYLGRFVHHVPSESAGERPDLTMRETAQRLFSNIDERFWSACLNDDCTSCDCCPANNY